MKREIKSYSRPKWFKVYGSIFKLIFRRSRYYFLGEEFSDTCLILSNHCGARAPMAYELYYKKPFRFFGTYEMTQGLKSVHKYLTTNYLYKKKHFPKFWAVTLGTIIAPLVNLFYKGMNLIPTYPDNRFSLSLREGLKAIQEGASIIIFPEDSSKGYLNELTKYYAGFIALCEFLLSKGVDISIYNTYLQKDKMITIVDKPVKYSVIRTSIENRDELAMKFCERANELGKMKISKKEAKKLNKKSSNK